MKTLESNVNLGGGFGDTGGFWCKPLGAFRLASATVEAQHERYIKLV